MQEDFQFMDKVNCVVLIGLVYRECFCKMKLLRREAFGWLMVLYKILMGLLYDEIRKIAYLVWGRLGFVKTLMNYFMMNQIAYYFYVFVINLNSHITYCYFHYHYFIILSFSIYTSSLYLLFLFCHLFYSHKSSNL